jgi:hypothetical protein
MQQTLQQQRQQQEMAPTVPAAVGSWVLAL